MSWIHGDDFVSAVRFVIERDDLDCAINFAAPNPLSQRLHARAAVATHSILA